MVCLGHVVIEGADVESGVEVEEVRGVLLMLSSRIIHSWCKWAPLH
jgi:hypothetical protein